MKKKKKNYSTRTHFNLPSAKIIQKCPDKAWQLKDSDTNPSCSSVKTWFGKCGKDIDALKKIMENGHRKQ